MRDIRAVALIMAAWLGPVSAGGQVTEYMEPGNADSVFAQIRSRLAQHKYHADGVDVPNRWIVVEPPGQQTKVEVRVEAKRDSATVKIEPLDAKDMVAGLQASIQVTADAALEAEKPGAVVMPASGELPRSNWRPEVFLSPLGRLWIARSGIFTTDSLFGSWRLSFDPHQAGIRDISLSLGTSMAFVDEDTLFMGLRDELDGRVHPRLYRSTDAGKSWKTVATGGVASVDVLDAIGASVWGFASYFDHEDRRTAFLRTTDGGVTWTRAPLPPRVRDVTNVYRVSPAVAYIATSGDSLQPAFWLTSDGGKSWLPMPTPKDQKVNDVPTDGVRIERIALVGEWLVVREYGKVFVTHPDSIGWRRLPDLTDIAADRERDHLFALTKNSTPEMLDANLAVIWKCRDKIPNPDDIDGILARDGAGYVWTGHSAIYEARDGTLRVRKPKG